MRVTLDGHEVFMDPKDLPGISYAVQDPLDPSKIKGTRSTSFILPPTRAARAHAGPLALSEEAAPIREISFGESGVDYLRAKVVPIEASTEGYRLAAIAGNASWIEEAKNTNIQDLKMGNSPVLSPAVLIASWTAVEDEPLYFPVIDYGSILDTDTSTTSVNPDLIRPAVRVNNVVRRFFQDEGYSVKIEGRLNRIWKKLVIPNTHDDIKIIGLEDAETTLGSPSSFIPTFTLPLIRVPQDIILSDPSGSINGAFDFMPAVAVTVRVTVKIVFTIQYAAQVPGTDFIPVHFWLIGAGLPSSNLITVHVYNYWLGPQTNSFVFTFADQTLVAGIGYSVRVRRHHSVTSPTLFTVQAATITWDVLNQPYQMGVAFDIASALPSMTVMDCLGGVGMNQGLVFSTNDEEKIVTIQRYDDFYKPHETHGIDLSHRIDHPVVRIEPDKPKRIRFLWAEDGKDFGLETLNDQIGERKYGGHVAEITGGRDDEKVVKMAFAPTAMRFAMENLFIPTLKAEDQTPGEPDYDWNARLLVADGVLPGEWTLDGVLLTDHPNCYFIHPNEPEFSLSFGIETVYGGTLPGTVGNYYTRYLYRLVNSPIMEAALRLFDDELIVFDFGIPVLMHDGFEPHWMYFTRINNKVFGLDAPTVVQLIRE